MRLKSTILLLLRYEPFKSMFILAHISPIFFLLNYHTHEFMKWFYDKIAMNIQQTWKAQAKNLGSMIQICLKFAGWGGKMAKTRLYGLHYSDVFIFALEFLCIPPGFGLWSCQKFFLKNSYFNLLRRIWEKKNVKLTLFIKYIC